MDILPAHCGKSNDVTKRRDAHVMQGVAATAKTETYCSAEQGTQLEPVGMQLINLSQ